MAGTHPRPVVMLSSVATAQFIGKLCAMPFVSWMMVAVEMIKPAIKHTGKGMMRTLWYSAILSFLS
jgi:hypothetical protein